MSEPGRLQGPPAEGVASAEAVSDGDRARADRGEVRFPIADIESGSAVRLDAGPSGVCLVRIGQDFYAIGDRCSHANVSLAQGDIDVEDCWIECWKHGSAFSLADGEPQSLPATQPVPVYPVRVDGDDVVVKVS